MAVRLQCAQLGHENAFSTVSAAFHNCCCAIACIVCTKHWLRLRAVPAPCAGCTTCACLLSSHRIVQLDLSNQDMMERVIGTNGNLEDELTGSDVALFKSQRSPKSTADLNDGPFD